jgi:hypothetical protein
VKNVNVLADAHFLEEAQEDADGFEFARSNTYSFFPVEARGVFHPKILMLVGKQEGLLILGSGNMTSSGLSINDEVWAAFHRKNDASPNNPLFSSVWTYLSPYIRQMPGFLAQKVEWLYQFSPWLRELEKGEKLRIQSGATQVRFLFNSAESSIFQELIRHTPQDGLQALTVVSPYYDKSGELLRALKAHYEPEIFNCLIDPDFGLLPHDLPESVAREIHFFEWGACGVKFEPKLNRLHAKIFHFQYQDGTEWMLLGSANATVPGMGIPGKNARNEEACLLITRKAPNKSWLAELGIQIPDTPVQLSGLSENRPLRSEAPGRTRKKISIKYTELRGDTIVVFTKEAVLPAEHRLEIIDREGLTQEVCSLKTEAEELVALCSNPRQVFRVIILDKEGARISNYSIVHRYNSLLMSNPDPEQEKLNSLLDIDDPDAGDIADLLDYTSMNWADEETANSKFGGGAASTRGDRNPAQVTEQPEQLSEEEFNQASNEILARQAGLLYDPNVKIAEFLDIYSTNLNKLSEANFDESEEQKLLNDEEQQGEGEEIKRGVEVQQNGKKAYDAIYRYLHRLQYSYGSPLDRFLSSGAITEAPGKLIQVRGMSSLLIALQLLYKYQGDYYEDEYTSDNGEIVLIKNRYFYDGRVDWGKESLKWFLIDCVGCYHLIFSGGIKEYGYAIVDKKLKSFLVAALAKTVFLILNTQWSTSEQDLRDLLLLNSLYYFNPFEEFSKKQLQREVDHLKQEKEQISRLFEENYAIFFKKELPRFTNWLNTFRDNQAKRNLVKEVANLREGSVIYKSRLGFNKIKRVKKQGEKTIVDLIRPGYDWDEKEKTCLLAQVEFSRTCIVYS